MEKYSLPIDEVQIYERLKLDLDCSNLDPGWLNLDLVRSSALHALALSVLAPDAMLGKREYL